MKQIRSVLIVDDDPDDAFFAEKALQRWGAVENVRVVCDGEQALELWADPSEGFDPTIALIDISMPRLGGFDFLDELVRRGLADLCATSFCILTSSFHNADIERATSHPLVTRYVPKPLDQATVEELIELYGVAAAAPPLAKPA